MGLRIRGFEKAWMALAGLSVPVTTGALWLVSASGEIPPPSPENITAAVVATVATLFAAFGAYIAANSKPENQAQLEAMAAEILRQSASSVAAQLRDTRSAAPSERGKTGRDAASEPVKPASEPHRSPIGAQPEPEPEPVPQPAVLAVKPLRPVPRPAERTDEDEAG